MAATCSVSSTPWFRSDDRREEPSSCSTGDGGSDRDVQPLQAAYVRVRAHDREGQDRLQREARGDVQPTRREADASSEGGRVSEIPYNRLLAINAAAAGPYKLTGKCYCCGTEQAVVNFPRPFSTSIAVCRRCRFGMTGIEDKHNMIQATATVAKPEAFAKQLHQLVSDGVVTEAAAIAMVEEVDFTIEDAG